MNNSLLQHLDCMIVKITTPIFRVLQKLELEPKWLLRLLRSPWSLGFSIFNYMYSDKHKILLQNNSNYSSSRWGKITKNTSHDRMVLYKFISFMLSTFCMLFWDFKRVYVFNLGYWMTLHLFQSLNYIILSLRIQLKHTFARRLINVRLYYLGG